MCIGGLRTLICMFPVSFMFNRSLDLAQENPTSYSRETHHFESNPCMNGHITTVFLRPRKPYPPSLSSLIIPVVNRHDSSQIVKIPLRYRTCCLRYFIPIRLDYFNYPNITFNIQVLVRDERMHSLDEGFLTEVESLFVR